MTALPLRSGFLSLTLVALVGCAGAAFTIGPEPDAGELAAADAALDVGPELAPPLAADAGDAEAERAAAGDAMSSSGDDKGARDAGARDAKAAPGPDGSAPPACDVASCSSAACLPSVQRVCCRPDGACGCVAFDETVCS